MCLRGGRGSLSLRHWNLPVGKADKGEVITTTALRELREETGLVVDPAALKGTGVIHVAWGASRPPTDF